MLEYQNIKTSLLKVTFQIGPKKFLLLKKIKNTMLWIHLIEDLNGEVIMGTFDKKELQKTSPKEFRVEKVIKRKGYKL